MTRNGKVTKNKYIWIEKQPHYKICKSSKSMIKRNSKHVCKSLSAKIVQWTSTLTYHIYLWITITSSKYKNINTPIT